MTTLSLLPTEIAERVILVTEGTLNRFSEMELRQALAEHGSARSTRRTKHRLGNSGTLVLLSSAATGETLVVTPAEERAMKGATETFNPTRTRQRPGGAGPRRSVR